MFLISAFLVWMCHRVHHKQAMFMVTLWLNVLMQMMVVAQTIGD